MTPVAQRSIRQQPPPSDDNTAAAFRQSAPWRPLVQTSSAEPLPELDHSPLTAPDGGVAGGPAPAPGDAARERRPLSVAPAPRQRSAKGFVTACAAVLLLALITVLLVNITVANRQYELIGLKDQQLELTQANEALGQEAEHHRAPQNVAQRAVEMGMVLPGDVAAIDLGTGQVNGVATPAQEDDIPSDFVSSPTVSSGQAGEDAGAQDEGAQDEGAEGEGAESATAPEERPSFDSAALNGGTIPAPSLEGDRATD